MEALTDSRALVGRGPAKGKVIAWSMWDWGSAAFNAVIITFVFSVYLVESVGSDVPGPFAASTLYSWALGGAGLFIAVLAPVLGQNADARGSRKRSLLLLTAGVVSCMFLMFFVKDENEYLWFGLALVAVGSVLFELSQVPYFSMLRQVSTPENVGRVSGIGWAFGYLGGIVLLLISFYGFIAGEGDARGLLGITTDTGLNIRLVAVLAAAWFLVFALPLFWSVPEVPVDEQRVARTRGMLESYRALWIDAKDIWRNDRRTMAYLVASAVFRDGLSGVFAFGAILAVTVYGIDKADVLIFGVAANVIAAAGAFAAGVLDDKIGSKPVIVFSLGCMVVVGAILFVLDGPLSFWILGLILCAFVGPAQSAARTFLTRITPVGREGRNFGMYAMTGRAVSFLAPSMFGLFVFVGGNDDRYGMIGIVLVLAIGLIALLFIRGPERDRALDDPVAAITRGPAS